MKIPSQSRWLTGERRRLQCDKTTTRGRQRPTLHEKITGLRCQCVSIIISFSNLHRIAKLTEQKDE